MRANYPLIKTNIKIVFNTAFRKWYKYGFYRDRDNDSEPFWRFLSSYDILNQIIGYNQKFTKLYVFVNKEITEIIYNYDIITLTLKDYDTVTLTLRDEDFNKFYKQIEPYIHILTKPFEELSVEEQLIIIGEIF